MFSWTTRWPHYFGIAKDVLKRAEASMAAPAAEEAELLRVGLRLELWQRGALLFEAEVPVGACADVELFDIREHEDRLGRRISWLKPGVRERMAPEKLERVVWCERAPNALGRDAAPWDGAAAARARLNLAVLRRRLPENVAGLVRSFIPRVRRRLEPEARAIHATLTLTLTEEEEEEGRRRVVRSVRCVGVPHRGSFGFKFHLQAGAPNGRMSLTALADFGVEDIRAPPPRRRCASSGWRNPCWRHDVLTNNEGNPLWAPGAQVMDAVRADAAAAAAAAANGEAPASTSSFGAHGWRRPRRRRAPPDADSDDAGGLPPPATASMGVKEARVSFYLTAADADDDEPRSGASCAPTPRELLAALRRADGIALWVRSQARYDQWKRLNRIARFKDLRANAEAWYAGLTANEAELAHDIYDPHLQETGPPNSRARDRFDDYLRLRICVLALDALSREELDRIAFTHPRATFLQIPPALRDAEPEIDARARALLAHCQPCLCSNLPEPSTFGYY